ncbi:MAG: inorganic pyrophosphatase [Desulfobacteraceae bacterium]|jgi:inorganic pyrophosphatase|nr:MAG: inorganic pyrophosphatase [Desulfobacteraceae bacterium]
MLEDKRKRSLLLERQLFRAHPWHGVTLGDGQPETVTVYIEVVPSDTVKYELDKDSGLLKVDRPQIYSNIYPTLYGMLPQTYCGSKVAGFCTKRSSYENIVGDGDPLDICVLTEKLVPHGDILLKAHPIGGFRMIDNGEADDKIIAVLQDDALYREWQDVRDCPQGVIERLRHFFLTYKHAPGSKSNYCEIVDVYGRDDAYQVIKYAHEDYLEKYRHIEDLLSEIM